MKFILNNALVLLSLALCDFAFAEPSAKNTGSFWKWFQTREAELAILFSYESGAKAQNDPKLQKKIEKTVLLVGDKLREVHPEFSPYFGFAAGSNIMTVTVHGEAELFHEVDKFIQSAPKVGNWEFVALKQPREMYAESEIHTGTVQLRVGDWSYLKKKTSSGKYNFQVYVPNKVSDDPDGFNRLFTRLIMDSLGERLANTVVGKVSVIQNPTAMPSGLIKFTDIISDVEESVKSDEQD